MQTGITPVCYSAQIRQDYRKFVREFGAVINIKEFLQLYWNRKEGSKAKIPKAMDASFANPQSEDEQTIKSLGKLADLKRPTLIDEDSRIFPGWYAPVMVSENGQRVIKPMRYQCRPAGKPALMT